MVYPNENLCKTEVRSPQELLEKALQPGVEGINSNAYINCVYTQL
ncbi:hypothetical protein [Okeania sp. KiyG1]|nr:hypothetical protein [Okeania sp. KiyG1]